MNSPTSTGKRISLWLGIMLCVTILALSACGRSREESVETPTVEPTFTVAEPTATEAPPTPTEEPAANEAPAAEEAAVDETATMTDTEAITETAAVTEAEAAVDAAETMTDTEEAAVDATAAMTETEDAGVDATETVTDTEEPAAEEPAAEAAPADTSAEGGIDVAAVTATITKGTCNACHMIPGIEGANIGVIGPNLANIGVAAATRVEGQTAEEYIQNSIRNPNDFIAPECPTGPCLPNLMLQNLTEMLTDDEINLVVSYLLTLDGSQ